MSRFNVMEEQQMCQLLDRMTAQKEFWHDKVPATVQFQRFGFQLREADFVGNPVHHNGFQLRSRSPATITNSGLSIVKNGKKEFEIRLDVWPFERHELSVLIVPGKYISIKGEHGEKDEDGSTVSRKFQRYYHLPKGSNNDRIQCEYFGDKTVRIRVAKDGVSHEVHEEIVPLNLVSCRNMPLPTDEQYKNAMPDVQNVSISCQNEAVTDLQNKIPAAAEDSKKEESSKPEGEHDRESTEGVTEDSKKEESSKPEGDRESTVGVSEDSKTEESSKSEIEPVQQSPEDLSGDSKSEKSGKELPSATKEDGETDPSGN